MKKTVSVIGLLLLTTACAPHSPSDTILSLSGENTDVSVEAVLPDVPRGDPFIIAGIPICYQGGSAPTITAVEPTDEAITVVDYSIRPSFDASVSADGLGTLEDLGYTTEKSPPAACPGTSELALELARPAAESGETAAFTVHCKDTEGNAGSFLLPYTVRLCAPGDKTGKCDF